MKTLILGGVRSGKSRLAERIARESGRTVIYIATADASGDEAMAARIAAHRAHRPPEWRVVEEPRELARALRRHDAPGHCLLVDCLTLWLTNLLTRGEDHLLERERDALLDLLPTLDGDILLVSNETNLGVIPLGTLSRRFCDEAGLLHQALASVCDRVILTVAGLPHSLKGDPI